MDLDELTAYAERKHHIGRQQRRKLSVGVTALVHPVSGKWVAVLMRAWDELRGEELQLCDLKCGHGEVRRGTEPWLTAPHRMKGPDWVGVRFGAETGRETVFRLFDEAMSASRSWGYTVTLGSMLPAKESEYRDTPLPPPGERPRQEKPKEPEVKRTEPASLDQTIRRLLDKVAETAQAWGQTLSLWGEEAPQKTEYRETPLPPRGQAGGPEKLRELRRLYRYGVRSFPETCRNFYKQGKFMEDYEDDAPWNGEVRLYYPTYQDLRLEQLRGYFTWRTALRRGEFKPISTSLAYIYIYELLNDIGAADAVDSLRKLNAFRTGYLDAGFGDAAMRLNLRRWMLEKAVVSGLPPETVREYADPETLRRDGALAALRDAKARTDGEIFDALVTLGGGKLLKSPAAQDEEGKSLFARVWRQAAAAHREGGKSLFTLCFGGCRSHRWDPLASAVYHERRRLAAGTCEVDECRSYTYNGSVWSEKCYLERSFDKKLLAGLLHEAERQLRLYRKLGRPLQERYEERWAAPYIQAVIEEDRREKAEKARKKVTIDLSGLEQIRRDALLTRDSLLTEEDLREAEEPAETAPAPAEAPEEPVETVSGLPLDEVQTQLLKLLLEGKPAKGFLAEQHRMPTVEADAVNEALYDEIGDSVLECDGDEIALAEDYREDLLRLLGGTTE